MARWPCRFAGGRREWGCVKTTVPVRLYPPPHQAAILRAHCQEYISTIKVLVAALDSDVLPAGGTGASTKDFTAALPGAVKNQALRDARSVWKRSVALGVIPGPAHAHLPVEPPELAIEGDKLLIPVSHNGQVGQIAIRCSTVEPLG